ncbi:MULTISPECIES: class I SAM-dependent RNA methyltransferase [unclassified Saccharopolyspora]|uniref:class I SAM-dependent RNA methyltransferase n=1 Tax=unclassified Saccharopolyspora TaxID=2646250 RepID=UPI001CD6CD07|nr:MULTISPECIES: TRAM domain-containing protein [unclassified Saccharopolyspora]MCA1193128.1 TRAM domain-containing protein [Saccharopolyspora sp. 6V]MCA1279038.1 TRAM domain-containing protein [Saccharopolyspora sp. 7B]
MTEKLDWTGRRLKLDVGPVAHGGHCVARHEGRVVFVRHALPGEVVLAEVTDDPGKGFCRADAVEVFTAAEGRVAPPCPLADMALGHDRCGGCDWQHADHGTQRELKAAVLHEQLQRLAGLDRSVEVQELPGGPLRWRTRVRLAVDRVGRPGFHPHRSHRVLPVQDCPITVRGALDGLTDREWPQGAELEVAADADSAVHLTLRERAPQRRRGKRGAVVSTPVHGSATAREQAAGRSWDVSADGFWQVHPAAADTFARAVARMAQVPAGGVAWDLYGGVGLFASVLAEQAGPAGDVLLVESSRRATEDAVANLRDLPQVSFRAGTVEEVLADEELPAPNVVVLDPPRKGAGRRIVEAVCAAGPERVVHVACDPAALARDVSLFAEQGYRLADLEAFDAFPMTHHMECIALLTRG